MTDPGLTRLVHGVLWPGFLGTEAPGWLLRARDDGLAGVVLFAQNVQGGAAPTGLDGDDSLVVGIDEEGGQVTRVQAERGSTLPSAAQLGRVDDVAATQAVGAALGGLAASVGASLVAAPVADVNVAPANPVIGTRSFGADPLLVSRHVAAQVAGLADAGVLSCAKHWPGHGDTLADSHHGLAVSAASVGETDAVHVPPFAAAVAAGVPAIMTAHVVAPEWGPEPATLSPTALGRLRSMGFDGAIVSDALDMQAVRRLGIGVAAVRALGAGCDLLCIGNPANPGSAPADETLVEVRSALLAALDDGTLPLARLEQAHERVARLRSLAAATAATRALAASVPLPDALATRVVRDALHASGPIHPIAPARLVIDARPAPSWAVATGGVRIAETLADGGAVVRPDTRDEACHQLEQGVASGVVVLADRLADERQLAIVEAAIAVRPDAIVVDLGVEPPAATMQTASPAVLRAFGASRLTAEVLAETLRAGLERRRGLGRRP